MSLQSSVQEDSVSHFRLSRRWFVYSSITFLATFTALYHHSSVQQEQQKKEVYHWLRNIGSYPHRKAIYNQGCTSLVRCASLMATADFFNDPIGDLQKLPTTARASLMHAGEELRRQIVLQQWLQAHGVQHLYRSLTKFGINSLQDICKEKHLSDIQLSKTLGVSDWGLLQAAVSSLPSSNNDLTKVTETTWNSVIIEEKTPWGFGAIFFVSLFVTALTLVGMATTMSQTFLFFDHSTTRKLGCLAYVTGKYLAPQNCKVEFLWSDPEVVGSTLTFTIKFFQRNGRAYPICNEDNFLVEITQGTNKIACSVELGGQEPSDANKACVQFSVRHAGEYKISVLLGVVHIRGSPFIKHFLPGPPEPQKTGFVHHCSTVVCTEGLPYQLFIELRDQYNNLCVVEAAADPSDEFSVDIVETNTGRPVHAPFRWECHPQSSRIGLILKLDKEGCYRATVFYCGAALRNGDFHIIVLNRGDACLVQKNVAKKSHNIWYEARLISVDGQRLPKSKKVYCYISPKQLTIREFMLKFIPKRFTTFRLCPSTKFQFQSANNKQESHVLVIDDGCQPQVELVSAERNVIAATFTQFLLKNIGGSETFKDKQDFFYHEVRKLHQKHFHEKLPLRIHREKLLEGSMKTTKSFSLADWCKNFEITFLGEEGVDWGGLRREWFELVCEALFDPENLLFHRFKNDKQGLAHPNPWRPLFLKLKHYEFAGKIVGKCLYESALGSTYRQLVKARFSRSFLAQLIGLRVHYKYFEQDDPDLYVSKIRYILENDVEDMELTFTEEEYDNNGQLVKVVELIPGGSRIQVTSQNKLKYLDALAQYRLANNVKEEVEAFLKGLNELIPDNLLSIFDEYELELLMCGTGHYSIADFKGNHAMTGSSYEFRKVLDWFWTAVSNFTEEEMARLLQFTTGCSQLPPGGFAELNPKFHLVCAPTFGVLPTAHTCFNQLCLPDYDSYQQFESALRFAINEGSEGFGMI
ncbi:apoptosis-resistant E3 ubiquitin protein ligase 1-like isoform X1 [Limulus polyphemus]|uniref:HECT-type E3 ubiquitin transferase n=2 Tax=Limulus polyphemus TaxID=6850 RepID=A0ABM1BGB7_LIMPO|nr:apoptosis-resistant E3 ubiquitin protein ligase 1-like isoform X1 [Limulus polyphemus]